MPQTVQRGSTGADVKKLQELLNRVLTPQQMRDAGVQNPPLNPDGIFGANTQAAVTYYKTKNQLTGGSVVGPTTWQHLERSAQSAAANSTAGNAAPPRDNRGFPDTRTMSMDQKYDTYYAIMQTVRQGNVNSANQALSSGRQVILGLRKVNILTTHGVYDDRCILLRNNGGKRAYEFTYNTEPAARYRSRYPNLGRVSEGVWQYISDRHYIDSLSDKRALVPVEGTRADRDFDGDNRYSNNEIRAGTSPDMLFHIGSQDDVGSAGCQTFQPGEWTRFWNTLNHSQSKFWYVLINYC